MKPYDKYVDLVVNEILKFYTPDRDRGIMRSKKAPRIFFTPIKNSKYVEWSLPSYRVEKEMTQAIEDYATKASITSGELGADFITMEEQRLSQAINNKLVQEIKYSRPDTWIVRSEEQGNSEKIRRSAPGSHMPPCPRNEMIGLLRPDMEVERMPLSQLSLWTTTRGLRQF